MSDIIYVGLIYRRSVSMTKVMKDLCYDFVVSSNLVFVNFGFGCSRDMVDFCKKGSQPIEEWLSSGANGVRYLPAESYVYHECGYIPSRIKN